MVSGALLSPAGLQLPSGVLRPVERNSRKLIELLRRDGWERVAVKGSHWHFKHPSKDGRVTVPHPVQDIAIGTVATIYRQAGWR